MTALDSFPSRTSKLLSMLSNINARAWRWHCGRTRESTWNNKTAKPSGKRCTQCVRDCAWTCRRWAAVVVTTKRVLQILSTTNWNIVSSNWPAAWTRAFWNKTRQIHGGRRCVVGPLKLINFYSEIKWAEPRRRPKYDSRRIFHEIKLNSNKMQITMNAFAGLALSTTNKLNSIDTYSDNGFSFARTSEQWLLFPVRSSPAAAINLDLFFSHFIDLNLHENTQIN